MNMREKMARAMFVLEFPPGADWDADIGPFVRGRFLAAADAALSALAEPTEAMLDAVPGAREVVSSGTWDAMIGAAGEG